MQKNLLEKLGDLLGHPGKRFLIGFAAAAIGVILLPLPIAVGFVGLFLFLGGAFTAFSILESTKSFFVTSIPVPTSTGAFIPCTIVKQKHYAFMPVVPFVCPFFYLPYKTQYLLIKNMVAPSFTKDLRINDEFLSYGLLNMEPITKGKAKALMLNPQFISKEIEGQVAEFRNQFCKDINPFAKAGLIEEIYSTNRLSICKLQNEEVYFLFHYAKSTDGQRGFILNKEKINKIKEDSSFLLSSYLQSNIIGNVIIELNDQTLERLLSTTKTVDSEVTKEILEQTEQKKELLTKEVIENQLRKKYSTVKKGSGWAICFGGLGAGELAILGLVTGMIVMGLIFLAASIALFYFGIKRIRQGNENLGKILKGQYKIIKAVCTSVKKEETTNEDGTYYTFTTVFSNGETCATNTSIGVADDPFYLVYLEGSKELNSYFNGILYRPAPELRIEDAHSINTFQQTN